MDPKLQTSFIPKKNTGESRHRSVPLGFFTILGYIIFCLSIFAAVGLFGANFLLTQNIAAQDTKLSSKVKTFDAHSINDLIRFNSRLETAKKILASHLATSAVFSLLSQNTIQSVQFNAFNYVNDGAKINVSLMGKAPNFASLAFQSDTFSQVSYLRDQVFSDITLGQDGTVGFKFIATVDPTALVYTVATSTTPSNGAPAIILPN
jgi:hypothetical protein